jgi:hypothetical protein
MIELTEQQHNAVATEQNQFVVGDERDGLQLRKAW